MKKIADSIGLLCACFVLSLSPVMLCDLGEDILIACGSSMAHRSRVILVSPVKQLSPDGSTAMLMLLRGLN